MIRRAFLTAVAIAGTFAGTVCAQAVRVAAAADLQFAMPEIAARFEGQTGVKASVTYGSSGNLFSQIQNGAPFDVFLSADMDYPKKLQTAGFAQPGTLFIYGVGHIAIWMPADTKIDLLAQGWNALRDERVQKIAIANPEHAPYGRAAIAALTKAALYEQLKSKLVYGESISQAVQFVQSGNAQAGILAKSIALSPAMRSGKRWDVPIDLYPTILQGAVLLNSAANTANAKSFLEFVKGPEGRTILDACGFGPASAADVGAATK